MGHDAQLENINFDLKINPDEISLTNELRSSIHYSYTRKLNQRRSTTTTWTSNAEH